MLLCGRGGNGRRGNDSSVYGKSNNKTKITAMVAPYIAVYKSMGVLLE